MVWAPQNWRYCPSAVFDIIHLINVAVEYTQVCNTWEPSVRNVVLYAWKSLESYNQIQLTVKPAPNQS